MTTQPPNKPKRRTYSAEFKELLVKEAESSGRSIASIAREHGINQNLLHNWKRQYHRKKTQTGILPAAINSPADPNPCFIPIRLEPQATHLSSPSVIQNIKLQIRAPGPGSISLTIAQIDTQSLIDLLRGLQWYPSLTSGYPPRPWTCDVAAANYWLTSSPSTKAFALTVPTCFTTKQAHA